MSNILLQIQEIAKNEGITISSMEKVIGASKGVLSRAIANGTDIQSKWIQAIVDNYPRYSVEWLITGKGNMRSLDVPEAKSIKRDDEFTSIPVVEVSVAAGCSGYDNGGYIEILDSLRLPSSMAKPNHTYFCVKIKGESMAPTLLDSGFVIIRLLNRSEWADMPEKHIYVVSDRNGKSYIKRVKNRLHKYGFITCMSDNPDKANYPNFNLQEEEINTILHAEWYFTAKMPNIHEQYYNKVSDLEDKIDVLQNQMGQVLKKIQIK